MLLHRNGNFTIGMLDSFLLFSTDPHGYKIIQHTLMFVLLSKICVPYHNITFFNIFIHFIFVLQSEEKVKKFDRHINIVHSGFDLLEVKFQCELVQDVDTETAVCCLVVIVNVEEYKRIKLKLYSNIELYHR